MKERKAERGQGEETGDGEVVEGSGRKSVSKHKGDAEGGGGSENEGASWSEEDNGNGDDDDDDDDDDMDTTEELDDSDGKKPFFKI